MPRDDDKRTEVVTSSDSTKRKRQIAKLLAFLANDAINGGYGPPAAIFNLAQAFPDYTDYFLLPTSAATLALATFCSYKRTRSAINDKDGSSSFIEFNIGIDFFTTFNFMLDFIAAITSAALGPEAEDAPWSISGPIFAAAFLAGATYAVLATKKHHGTLNSTGGKLALEVCQFLQIISAGTSLTQLITNINPSTWPDFLKVFLPSLGIGTIFRMLRSKYPVLYKIGDDIIPALAYMVQSGLLLSKPYEAPFFIFLALAAFGMPAYALVKNLIGDQQIQAIAENPTLLPRDPSLMFRSATSPAGTVELLSEEDGEAYQPLI
jgi:hypothetical protein